MTISQHYDELAAHYDAESINRHWIPNDVLARVLSELGPNPGRFLDLGAGTGQTAAVLQRYAPTSITCVEPSFAMARRGEERVPSATWVVSGAAEFLETRQCFDLITAVGVLEFVEDVTGFVAACAQATSESGRLALAFEVSKQFASGVSATVATEKIDQRAADYVRRPVSCPLVEKAATKDGLELERFEDFIGYERSGEDVPYALAVFLRH